VFKYKSNFWIATIAIPQKYQKTHFINGFTSPSGAVALLVVFGINILYLPLVA
jgi:hypothetical protein